MVCSAVVSGCTSEDIGTEGDGDAGYLHLAFSMEDLTKADIGADGSGNFSEGDRIGLYIGNGQETLYRELTYSAGEWKPDLKRSDFGSGELYLSAHYPAVPEPSDTSCDFDVATDQTGSGYAASDLLVAQAAVPEGKYDAVLLFRHAFHRLVISVDGAASDVSLGVRSRVSGTVDLLTGEVSGVDGDFAMIDPRDNGDGTFHAVILPQEAAPYRTGDGLVKIVSGDRSAVFAAPENTDEGNPLVSFLPGKETSVRLSIKSSQGPEDPDWAGRKVWLKGITAPDDSEWKQLFPGTYTTYSLAWDAKYGWYDCNKRNPSAKPGGIPDGYMCWAATASNLLHWWIDQNMAYVTRYGDRYKGPDYVFHSERTNDGGLENTTRQESDIFQCFIDSFADEAGKGDDGLNWFIHGIVPTAPALTNGNQGGYFKDVFPQGVKLAANVAGLGKASFNKAVKDALANGKGMGLSIGDVRSGHVVTLWGAEFDSDGYVSYIYMADNNDRNQYEVNGVGCDRYEIVYETLPEGGTITKYKSGFIPDDRPVALNRLVTLELGQEYWEEYLAKNNL